MERIVVPKRVVFYCRTCDDNPNEQPSEHLHRTKHNPKGFLVVTIPDFRRIPAGARRSRYGV